MSGWPQQRWPTTRDEAGADKWGRRVDSRQRQIDHGKAREEYERWRGAANRPLTPDPTARISKRAFARKLGAWRRSLHEPPSPAGASGGTRASDTGSPGSPSAASLSTRACTDPRSPLSPGGGSAHPIEVASPVPSCMPYMPLGRSQDTALTLPSQHEVPDEQLSKPSLPARSLRFEQATHYSQLFTVKKGLFYDILAEEESRGTARSDPTSNASSPKHACPMNFKTFS